MRFGASQARFRTLRRTSSGSARGPQRSTSFDLYSLRTSVPNGTSSTTVCTTSAPRSRSRIDSASPGLGVGVDVARQFDADGQRRVLLDSRRRRDDPDLAADRRGERAHHLTHGGREHVDAADDQHVVGPADAADPRPGPAAGTWRHSDRDVVPRPEPQQRRSAMAQVGEDELAGGAVTELDRFTGVRVDQLWMNEAAGAEVHPILGLALTPQRHADVPDPHRLGHARAPPILETRSEGLLAPARLPGDEHPRHRRPRKVDPALGRPLDQIRRIRRRQHGRLGPQPLHREHQPLGVAGPDRDVTQPDPVKRCERRAGDERPGVVARDDPLARPDPGGRVAAGRAGDPVLQIAGGQGDVAGDARRPARRVDPDDLRAFGAQVRADRVLVGGRRAELLLFGEREPARYPRGRRRPADASIPAAPSLSR